VSSCPPSLLSDSAVKIMRIDQPQAWHYSDWTSDLCRVNAASRLYSVLGKHDLYVVTWEDVSCWTSWCWRLLEGCVPSVFLQ
jgi:hypothetical protein